MKSAIPNVLTIAGVDPSGGAGIVADVKAISAQRAYACAVVAALTAQNTCAVTGVLAIEPAFVRQQLDALFADVRIDALKIGMLGERIVMAHAKDRRADGGFAAAGSGIIDFGHFVRSLRGAGFDGPLVAHGLTEAEAPAVAAFLQRLIAGEAAP